MGGITSRNNASPYSGARWKLSGWSAMLQPLLQGGPAAQLPAEVVQRVAVVDGEAGEGVHGGGVPVAGTGGDGGGEAVVGHCLELADIGVFLAAEGVGEVGDGV